MAHPYHEARSENREKAHAMIARTGHRHLAHGGRVSDEAEDKKMVTKAVHEHEDHEHGGEHTKLKLRDGGHMEAGKAKKHLAKRARGGSTPKHKGGVGKVQVIVAPQGGGGGGDAQAAHQQGMQQGAMMGAKAMAQKLGAGAPPGGGGGAGPPAPAGAPGAGPAPNAMPARPPMQGGAPMGGGAPGGMMRKRGGKVEMDAGAGGGEGRIEKMHEYGKGGFKPKDKMS
jgi:hypothetical protein